MPLIYPAVSEVNFMPTSTGAPALELTPVGVAVLLNNDLVWAKAAEEIKANSRNAINKRPVARMGLHLTLGI